MKRHPNVVFVEPLEITISGTWIKTARVCEEWDVDVKDPDLVVSRIRACGHRADLFTFVQRLPVSRKQYSYYMEWDNVAAIPITSYERWLRDQVHRNVRNKIKKSQKEGVVVRLVDFNDAWLRGIKEIQDEVPIRQGARYFHYGMDLATVKRVHSTYRGRDTCIGAYYKDEMIGYLKIVTTKGCARTMGILTKTAHGDKAPMNALIAKAVEVCAERGIPLFVYGKYDYGKVGSQSLLDLKRYSGFEHVLLPRYFVPLTPLGKLVLMTGIHRGYKEMVPQWCVRLYLNLRRRHYDRVLARWQKRKRMAGPSGANC